MPVRAFLALLLSVVIAQAAGATETPQKPFVTIGVRVDAGPFAAQDASTGSFVGFLVDLCTDAVTRAGYPFRQVPVTADERIGVLRGTRDDIDLLCDPTTITLGRLRDFAGLEPAGRLSFSPIVFVANGSYLKADGKKAAEAPPAAETAASPRPACIFAEPAPDGAKPRHVDAGYVVGTTIGPVLRDAIRRGLLDLQPGEGICPREFPRHGDAAAAFCRGDLGYYFGDADIIANSVQKTGRAEGCVKAALARPISYEPYALVISGQVPGFREDVIRALYEIFSDGTAFDRFNGHFEGRKMSPFLNTLFRINQIPAGGRAEAEAVPAAGAATD
ncbi:hypothetical protein RGUI_2298 [Rhodovulum sp. P5]|uniref:transporter substrate-binding domain-containing protein n=1 Tax=Rhodovulum sp. P5 TaxID=1564506 RepID=UPI0009C3919E|nr:transporter substrate-binding domain-containing protein [Rhodovulum sp. P5]ARE40439.1 hypothetical protein RGUI_2298 [Rhodovulum sp. P5]